MPHKETLNALSVRAPMKDVAGKVAFITGGSSGIGLGIARAFADAGMKVAIGYRSKGHLDEAMAQLKSAGDRVHAISVEVTDRPGMEQAAAETAKVFGKVHVIVNNAGVQNPSNLGTMSYQDWDALMRVNVDGVFNGVHAFLPHIKAHGEGGHVVTTASILGLFTMGSASAAYCASKFAVVAMMEALRVELSEISIGVSAFCPGVVRSNLQTGIKDSPSASDPLEVGELVLQGMRNNDLYILTHPEFEPVIRSRNEAIMASISKELRPTNARVELARSTLQRSIYPVERDRRLCARSALGAAT